MNINDVCTTLKLELKSDLNQEGRNSSVFIAHDPQLNADFVVKKIKKSSLDVDRYFEESKIMYSLNEYPHVVKIQFATQDDENIYLTMPYYKNGSLNSSMDKKFFNARQIISICLDILTGLHTVHSRNLLHFDLKPTNILFSDNKTAMLTDFGLSQYTDENGFAEQSKVYLAHVVPERFVTDKQSVHCDIYSVGLILYRLCNGNKDFQTQYKKFTTSTLRKSVIDGKFPDRKKFLPHIPNSLIRIVKKALNIDITKRYNSCIDIMNDLSKIENNNGELEWNYYTDENTFTWDTIKGTQSYQIKYTKNELDGKKVNISNQTTRKITDLCIKNIEIEDALKKINKFIFST